MRRQLYLLLAATVTLASACYRMEEMEAPAESRRVTISIQADHTECDPESKVCLDGESLKWTGDEKLTLIFGISGENGKDNNPSNPVTMASSSETPGLFSETVTIPSGFSISNLQAFVVPSENGAWFNYKNATTSRINMNIPAVQTQAKAGEPNWAYVPFFHDLTQTGLVETGTDTYSLPGGVTLKSASDLIRFNIYGSHAAQEKDEVFKYIRITSTSVDDSRTNISGTAEKNIGETSTGYNSNGGATITVNLEEEVKLGSRTKDEGLKMFGSICLGGDRYVTKVDIVTDKAIYTKQIKHKFPTKNINRFTIHPIEIDLSNGYLRESVVNTTKVALDPDGPRTAMGYSFANLSGYTMTVGDVERAPFKDSDGNWCIGEVEDKEAAAVIVWKDFEMPFGCEADKNAKIPFSQFHGLTAKTMSSYPLYGEMDENGTIVFKDAFALIDITVRGYTSLHSVKVRTLDGTSLAADGVDYVVHNCIREEDGAVPLQAGIKIPVLPGEYKGGLEITICDSKKLMQRFTADITSLSEGEVTKLDVTYTPKADLVFYEGFDNCTWGYDPTGKCKGYAPDQTAQEVIWRTALTGYENAFYEAPEGAAGSGFQQPDTWKNSYTVSSKHTMTETYVNSRDFMDWKYLFRSQEFQGCIGVGMKYNTRGWVESPALANLTETSLIECSFAVSITEGATENIEFQPLNAGTIIGLSIDSVPVLNSAGSEIWTGSSSYTLKTTQLPTGWHTVTFTINGATSATTFRIRGGSTSSSILHGFYLDDLTVRKVGVAQPEADGISELTSLSTIKASFELEFEEDDVNGVTMSLPTGGFICGLEIDGVKIKDAVHGKEAWPLALGHKIAPEEVTAGRHTVTYTIESADANTTFTFSGDSDCVSGLRVEKVSSIERGNFRLLLWNIQMGMWADQSNNYDNFVRWVKKYDPDCFAIVEAESVKQTGSTSNLSSSARYFPGGWSETAPRFDHPYAANGGNRDSYSQELTSKTAITTLQRITDSDVDGKPVQHGAGHFRITAGGKEIDIVTMHTWPQAYAPGTASADQDESKAAHEGDYYREHEVRYVLSKTVLSDEYSSQKNWILLGDMNSRSRADNWYYGYTENDTRLIAQDYIRNNTDLIDVIEMQYPGRFLYTNSSGTGRIDFIYVSPALYECIKSAIVVRDDWTSASHSGLSNYWYPSDHRPIIVDFNF